MTRNYYCLVAGLPELTIEQNKLSLTQLDFKAELQEFLYPDDFMLAELVFLSIDNKNILNLLTGSNKPFAEGGKYTRAELEVAIKDPEGLIDYMIEFINAYKDDIPIFPGISWENQLTTLYYKYVTSIDNIFLGNYFKHELQLNNIITALNCKKFNLSADKELIEDDEYKEHLVKNTSRDFGLSSELPYIEKLVFLFEGHDLLKREWDLDLMKWDYLDENTVFEYFTIEKVLSYLLKLGIIERWLKLDPEAGKELFQNFVAELKNSYEFPKEYAL
ncbi:MAG: DUF2764 family protein [Bacteroidales bacterium]|nr:DUF2764 family protein [Bacteroidales bacterium]